MGLHTYDEGDTGAPRLQLLHTRQAGQVVPGDALPEATQLLGLPIAGGPGEGPPGLALPQPSRHARDAAEEAGAKTFQIGRSHDE